jgi:hypothetical protein
MKALQEYQADCLRQLETHEWQKVEPDLAASYRARYESGGWSEEELITLTTLHMLWEWANTLIEESLNMDDKESALNRSYAWTGLPAGVELKKEVVRKCLIDRRLDVLESLSVAPDDPHREIYEQSLANARADALAASLGNLSRPEIYGDALKRLFDEQGDDAKQ